MKYIRLLYNSALWAILVSIALFQNEWVEMRVNIGLIGIISMIIFFITLIALDKMKGRVRKTINAKFTILNLITTCAILIILLGFKRLFVVPAAIIREVLKITSVSFTTLNIFIFTFLILGLIIIVVDECITK